jgi:hypothetical protein
MTEGPLAVAALTQRGRVPGIRCVVTDNFRDGTNSAHERLRAWVREDFGVQLSSIDRVGHGADTAAEVSRGIAVDRSQYAVIWSGGDTDAGPLVRPTSRVNPLRLAYYRCTRAL